MLELRGHVGAGAAVCCAQAHMVAEKTGQFREEHETVALLSLAKLLFASAGWKWVPLP